MASPSLSYRPGRYAAIDIGTVTARLLVADVDSQGNITELQRDHAICNLGVGVDKTGRLAPEAIERTGAAVARFVGAIDALRTEGGSPIVVVANATSASRDAENAADFVAVLADLGVELSVIPGEKEAGLSPPGRWLMPARGFPRAWAPTWAASWPTGSADAAWLPWREPPRASSRCASRWKCTTRRACTAR